MSRPRAASSDLLSYLQRLLIPSTSLTEHGHQFDCIIGEWVDKGLERSGDPGSSRTSINAPPCLTRVRDTREKSSRGRGPHAPVRWRGGRKSEVCDVGMRAEGSYLLLMIQVLHYLKDPKLWEFCYIPYYG